MAKKYDPGLTMTNPNSVDYLYPWETSLTKYSAGSGTGTGTTSYTTSADSVGDVPSYTKPSIASLSGYVAPKLTAAPTYTAPTLTTAPTYKTDYRELPTYKAKAWDDKEIDSLTQKRAAPGLRQLRQQVQKVTSRRYDNPQVGRMTLREALQGYGSGVSSVMGTASEAAASEYGSKYARESANAQAEYASEAAKAAAYNQYAADVAKTNYQGSFAQWQLENQIASDAAKTNYTTDMAEWTAANALKVDASKLNYQMTFEQWKAENSANEKLAERNHEAALAKWKAETDASADLTSQKNAYALQQQGFEAAWERWLKQQKYLSSTDGATTGNSYASSWSPNSKVIKKTRGY